METDPTTLSAPLAVDAKAKSQHNAGRIVAGAHAHLQLYNYLLGVALLLIVAAFSPPAVYTEPFVLAKRRTKDLSFPLDFER